MNVKKGNWVSWEPPWGTEPPEPPNQGFWWTSGWWNMHKSSRDAYLLVPEPGYVQATRVGIYSGGLLPLLLLQRVNDDRRDGKFYRTSHATLVVVPTDQPNRGQTSFANINTAAKAHTFRDFPTTGSLSRICSHYSRENMENIKVDPRLWSPFPQVHRTEGCFGAAGD